jgi:hypothetical protein
MVTTKKFLSIVLFCLFFMLSGCAISLGPQSIVLTESQKPPIFKLDRINENLSGAWPGGFRPFLANALSEPAAASFFTKDGSGLAMQIDITASHEDDAPRLIGVGVLSILTLGIIPLHYNSEWLVKCDVTIKSDDGAVLNRYSVQSTGVYDIWAYPLTMFSLFGASMRGDQDGKEILKRTATDLAYQIMNAIDADYRNLAAVYRAQPKIASGYVDASMEKKQQFSKQSRTPVAKPSPEAYTTIKSDIDELPTTKVKHNKNAYAIVIGIENYRQKLPNADFATSDARLVSEYLTKVMGYPEENIVTLANDHAALGDFVKYFEKWLPNNVEKGGTVFIYYSGHGAPNIKTGDAYLVPYDGDPTFITETGYPIARLYESLGKLKAKEITVVLDSCFSGAGGRSVLAKGAKPLIMTINMPTIQKNISVMTASSGDQISSAYEEKGHGLFTYFMLKGIKDEDVVKQDGSIKIDNLFGYIEPQVERIARKQYNNEQTPQLIGAKKN